MRKRQLEPCFEIDSTHLLGQVKLGASVLGWIARELRMLLK